MPCANGTDSCAPGQSVFWFSQGCTPGCPECDGLGQRVEGRALKSEKVVGPSTNRGRVNSLLSQAASLDTQALASIGLASSASEKYVRAKPPLPAL